MKVYGISDVGLVRKDNQDAFRGGSLPGDAAWSVVCDGMGGVSGGNIASGLAVAKITERVEASYREGIGSNLIKDILVAAIYEANTAVYERAKADESLKGMGTTVVATVIAGGIAHITHAGDSRAYLVTGEEIRQLTTDHSMVQEFVKSGDITQQQAKFHPQKNIITRALGVRSTVEVDYCECRIPWGGMLVLCTDGLTNYVEEEEICRLAGKLTLEEFCGRLIARAKESGGSDNITVSAIKNEQ